jgi:hypothetical protein
MLRAMSSDIPSAKVIRNRLGRLSRAQMQALSKASRVPFTTLWKVRTGETGNPGIETVRKFIAHMPSRAPRRKPVHTASYDGPDRRTGSAGT